MTELKALCGAAIFDGEQRHDGHALVIGDGEVIAIHPLAALPEEVPRVLLDGGIVAPGFVDLQVNGGGGVQFNADTSLSGIRKICAAHARLGTTAVMVTLISDSEAAGVRAVSASSAAARNGAPGFLGLHLEGPHLNPERAGAHDRHLLRPMDEADLQALRAARRALPHLMITVAPDVVTAHQIERLVASDIVVSLGHSAAGMAEVRAAAEAGATLVTHLFNAMGGINGREPGLAGAALVFGELSASVIADGHHVSAQSLSIALKSKTGPGKLFLVSDSMAVAGTALKTFELQGRTITREGGRLTHDDGTLAGADLSMAAAVRHMHFAMGLPVEDALGMASMIPAEAVGAAPLHGRLIEGSRADVVHLTDGLEVAQVWQGGEAVL